MLFEKPFIIFFRNTKNARINDLLEKADLGGQLVDGNFPLADGRIWAPVNWPDVSKRLTAGRERSAAFINRNIHGGKQLGSLNFSYRTGL